VELGGLAQLQRLAELFLRGAPVSKAFELACFLEKSARALEIRVSRVRERAVKQGGTENHPGRDSLDSLGRATSFPQAETRISTARAS